MAFNAREHIISLQGREYLEVKWREVWFRESNPAGSILTEIIADAAVRATVINNDGVTLATGMATIRTGKGQRWEGRDLEKAETAAIGRALAHAGFGTQFTDENEEEGDYLPDAPVEPRKKNNAQNPLNTPKGRVVKAYSLNDLKDESLFLYDNPVQQTKSLNKHTTGPDALILDSDSLQLALSKLVAYKAQQKYNMTKEDIAVALEMSYGDWLKLGNTHGGAWKKITAFHQIAESAVPKA